MPKKQLSHELIKKIMDDPEFPPGINSEMVQKLAEYGHTDDYMAEFFNVPLSTWEGWKRLYPEFYQALQFWKKFADEEVERALFERARGYDVVEEKTFCYEGQIITHETIKHYPPDVKAAAKWLDNRKPDDWKDKSTVEVQGDKELADLIIKANKRLKDKRQGVETEEDEEDIF